MLPSVKRGFAPQDARDFQGPALRTLHRAAEELYFLLNRGYPVKSAATFIGNHYLLSARQRMALARTVSSRADLLKRAARQKDPRDIAGETVHIDGFNQIITLEVAFSGSPVLLCMDGAFRDLAGLRGTYRLIDKTDAALRSIFAALRRLPVRRAVFWLDEPVSNSGRLKTRIAEIAEETQFAIGIEIVANVDKTLYTLPNVISSDSIVLDHCPSWLNLCGQILPTLPGAWILRLAEYPLPAEE